MQEIMNSPTDDNFRIRVQGRDNAETLALLRIDWPMARQVLDKLGAFLRIFRGLHSDDLARQIVERALSVYRDSVYPETMTKHHDPVRISRFIDSIITETCSAMQEDDTMATEESARLLQDSANCLRRSLYELLTSEQIKNVLRESNHEKTILAGGMAAGD